MNIKHFFQVSMLVAGATLSPIFAYENITSFGVQSGIALNGNPQIIDSVIEVKSVTTTLGGTVNSSFIGPSTSLNTAGTVSFTSKGALNTDPYPDANSVLLGNNLANATANGGGLIYNVMFGQTINDDSAGIDTNYEIFYFELIPSDEPYSLQAITGGTLAAPTLGGDALIITDINLAPIDGHATLNPGQARLQRSNDVDNFDGTFGGTAFDLNDLGVTSLIGIQFKSTGGSADPAAILAIPEPSSFILTALGFAGLLALYRRK